mmetsp:Transcript_1068/g.1734  ORF Transcript_1068/g.1734 Transcript_1068/m.1734 type:complete len:141 (-) Transcript_1068:63-485(-)
MMLSFPTARGEIKEWNTATWSHHDYISQETSGAPYLFLGHYCQSYTVSNFEFYKKRIFFLKDLRNCDTNLTLPMPQGRALEILEGFQTNQTSLKAEDPSKMPKQTFVARHAWMIVNTYFPVKEALEAYHDQFCTGQQGSK